ncbi:MAG: undecaprenyl-diphosphate phosphatase [Bacilli bacterium]
MSIFILILIAVLFGLVEGITEWLPISSTGHMILLFDWIPLQDFLSIPGNAEYFPAFKGMFLVVIQLGAIAAVIIYFWNKLWPWKKGREVAERKEVYHTWGKTLLACLPAAIVGIIADEFIDNYLFNTLTVGLTLVIYGVAFILLEIWNKKRHFSTTNIRELSYKTALLIGLIQLLALIPGTSRSGITILGAMLLGCSRETSAEFSFFLAIPIMLGASAVKGLKFFMNFGSVVPWEHYLFLLTGCLVAFIVSLLAVRWLMKFVKNHSFSIFGYYRIALGAFVLLWFILQTAQIV